MVQLKSARWGMLAAALILATQLSAQPRAGVDPEDAAEIQALVNSYASALRECRAEDFANLFVAGTGYFASGFRGHMVGYDRLVALVQSERHCTAPPATTGAGGAAAAQRPVGTEGPTVTLEAVAGSVRGIADLGTAEYQDEYTKTDDGWRFASRTVIIAAEIAAGLDAQELLAINALGGDSLGDYYEVDANGVARLMTSGVRVSVSDGVVNGRAFLREGGFTDEVYEKLRPGNWRVRSSTPGAN